MILVALKNLDCPYHVARVTKEYPDKLIYSIPMDDKMYYISKTIGTNDCAQIDGHPTLNRSVFYELCELLREIEPDCRRNRSLDLINEEIYKASIG